MNLVLVALGLMMVFEGIPLFCFPDQLKELARKLPELENTTLTIYRVGADVARPGSGLSGQGRDQHPLNLKALWRAKCAKLSR